MTFLFDYFKYIEKIDDPNLRNILIDIKEHGTIMEKIQAVTLLAAMKLFF